MPIVKMRKFAFMGLDTDKDSIMARLMEFGATELNSQNGKLSNSEWSKLVAKTNREAEVSALETQLKATDEALKLLSKYDKKKKPLFFSREVISEDFFNSQIAQKESIWKDVNTINDLSNQLVELKNKKHRIEAEVIGLAHWKNYQVPLEIHETKHTNFLIGVIPARLDIRKVEESIRKTTAMFYLSAVSKTEEHHYISLIYLKEHDQAVLETLKPFGFIRVSFDNTTGLAGENVANYKVELISLEQSINKVKNEIGEMSSQKKNISMLSDYLSIEYDRYKAFEKMLVTKKTFYLDGWVPQDKEDELILLFKQYCCHYQIDSPQKNEETPVLLRNNSLISPIESVTALYDTPNSRGLDPTPIFAFFYICFFGIMFADIAYGLILTFLSVFVIKKWKVEGNTRKFIKQLGYCGVSAFIWGIVFGGFFGNLVSVVSETFFGTSFSIAPLWINPIENAMTMLLFSCACGLIHIFVGLGVRAYKSIREGKLLDMIGDALLWYVLIIGLILLFAGDNLVEGLSTVGTWMSIVGAAGIVLLPIISGKGITKALGVWKLYGITRYLSDVLSYSRLMALCLAGTVIAQVFNTIAALPGNGIIGGIFFVLIVIIAHTFNFLVSALGAFVHSIRLQYVEFFDKFYEGNGTPFIPYMQNTKYIKLTKEGN